MISLNRSDYYDGDRWLGKRWRCDICEKWRSGKRAPEYSGSHSDGANLLMHCGCVYNSPDDDDPDGGEPISEAA